MREGSTKASAKVLNLALMTHPCSVSYGEACASRLLSLLHTISI